MGYTGRCACEAVTLTINAEPISVRQCWCRHCQRLSSGHATTNAIFAADAIATSGEVRWNEHVADSGNTLLWGFCPSCGTQSLAYSSARQHLRIVRLGALDRPHGLRPQVAIWTGQAPDWAIIPDHLERHPGQPPALPPPSPK